MATIITMGLRLGDNHSCAFQKDLQLETESKQQEPMVG